MSSDFSMLDRFFQFTARLTAPAPPWFAQYLWFPITFVLAVTVPFVLLGVLLPKLIEERELGVRGLLSVPFSLLLAPNLLLVWVRRNSSKGRLPNGYYWWGDFWIATERKLGDFMVWLITGRHTAQLFKWVIFLGTVWLLVDWNSGHCDGAAAACATPAASWWDDNFRPLMIEAFESPSVSLTRLGPRSGRPPESRSSPSASSAPEARHTLAPAAPGLPPTHRPGRRPPAIHDRLRGLRGRAPRVAVGADMLEAARTLLSREFGVLGGLPLAVASR